MSTCSFNTARQRLMMWKQKQSLLNNCSTSMSDVWKRIWHLKVMSAVLLLSTWIWDFMLTAVKGDWLSNSPWQATIFYWGKSFVRQAGVQREKNKKRLLSSFIFYLMIFGSMYRQNTLTTEHAVVLLLGFLAYLDNRLDLILYCIQQKLINAILQFNGCIKLRTFSQGIVLE